MKHLFKFVLVVGLVLGVSQWAFAQWGYKRKSTGDSSRQQTTQPARQARPAATRAPTSTDQQVIEAVRTYIRGNLRNRTLRVIDNISQNGRRLLTGSVHQPVHRLPGNKYYVCVDFTDEDTTEPLDIDFQVEKQGGQLVVTGMYVHRINGREQFAYRDGRRVPYRGSKVPMFVLRGIQKLHTLN